MSQTYATQGATRDEMIEKFLPMVNRIANRLAIGLPAHVDRGDLVSSGVMGLLDALEKYDTSKGSIKNYVPLRVKGAMIDELRKMSWLPRSLLSKIRQVEKSYSLLSATLGRVPSEEELASHLNVSRKEMGMLLAQINTKTLVHLEEYLFSGDENSVKVGDYIYDHSEWVNPEANLLKKEQQSRLAEAVDTLPEREQLILHMYYKDELTLKEIGEILEISESRVSQVHSKIMVTLRHKLREA
ncbi:MAG: FliA/WhiG family RNA polymerase sigma factor [Firmicutes bacterium]|nr:FliA/WhiG family RNA polymerase sigma factor [Bacillota bacterium]